MVTFTATFDKTVSRVTPADFHLTGPDASTTISQSIAAAVPGSYSARQWILTVTVTAGLRNTALTVGMGENSGSVHPPNANATNTFTVNYVPPTTHIDVPTTMLGRPVMEAFIVFSSPVSGLTASDVTVDSGTVVSRFTLAPVVEEDLCASAGGVDVRGLLDASKQGCYFAAEIGEACGRVCAVRHSVGECDMPPSPLTNPDDCVAIATHAVGCVAWPRLCLRRDQLPLLLRRCVWP